MGASQAPVCACCKEELDDERRVDGERRVRPVDPTADVVALEPVFSPKESAGDDVAVEPAFSVREHVFSTRDWKALGSFALPAARLPTDHARFGGAQVAALPGDHSFGHRRAASWGGTDAARPAQQSDDEIRRAASERLKKVPEPRPELPSTPTFGKLTVTKVSTPAELPAVRNFGKLTAAQVIAKAAAHVKTGDGAFARGDWASAVSAYTEALALNATLSSAWAGRGGANLRRGAFEDALADLDEALRLEEDSLFALLDRAEVRSRTGDLDGAIEDFDKKLSMAPADGRALCGRGEARLKKGDRNGAIADFQLAMRLSYPGAKDMYNAAKLGSRITWAS